MSKFIRVAIDGPAGAGKSSIAKAAAAELGFLYVDTGAMYRAVALFSKNFPDDDAFLAALPGCEISPAYQDGVQHIFLQGQDVSDQIRTPEISMLASRVAAMPEVRAFLLKTQRDIANSHDVFMDGRDIGTVVLPDAEVKIFLTASLEVRARRRFLELPETPEKPTLEAVLADMKARDENDQNRAAAPLKQAPDAVRIDTTNLDFTAAVDAVITQIRTAISLN